MHIDRRVAVGVELGGSKATIALIDERGQICWRINTKTLWNRPAQATLQPYLRAIETALAHARASDWYVRGIGVSIPGSLDQTFRRPLLVPTLSALNGVPLCELLEGRYDLPVHLHTDVEAILLGEQAFGAGRGQRRLVLIALNAAVGAALIVDGRLERTAHPSTGHVCHLPIAPNGSRCRCGARGCINTLISLEALKKMIQRSLRRGEPTDFIRRLNSYGSFNAQLLAEEALRGDRIALGIYNEVAHWLGQASVYYGSLFAPEMLILGGATLEANELLLTPVREFLATSAAPALGIAAALLGPDAALIGSAVPLLTAMPASGVMPNRQLADLTPAAFVAQMPNVETDPALTIPPRTSVRRRRSYDRPLAASPKTPHLVAEQSFSLYTYPPDDLDANGGLDSAPRLWPTSDGS